VDQSAVKKHCGDQAPPLMLDKYAVRMTGSETVGCFPAHPEKSMQAAGFACLHRHNQADA
jgi:hypothetical protein